MTLTSQARRRAAALLLAPLLAGAVPAWSADGLAAGTEIPVRLVGSPAWGQGQAGPTVTVAVERDVRSGDRLVVPRGSQLAGRLVEPRPGGAGDPMERRLVFSEIVIHGKAHRLSARPVTVVPSVTRHGVYCGTPTQHGQPPFKMGEYLEFSLPAGAQWTVRLSRPLVLGQLPR